MLVVLTALVSLVVPYFGLVTSLAGALGNNVMSFVVPPVLYYRLRAMEGYWGTEEEREGGVAFAKSGGAQATYGTKGSAEAASEHGTDVRGSTAGTAAESNTDSTSVGAGRMLELGSLVGIVIFGLMFLVTSTMKIVQAIEEKGAANV